MRGTVIESHNGQLMSKTQHYRKVTKPLLERKRRARMNQYLDELKNLIVETMEAQGEHITKLEKADILEMTVTYLRNKNNLITSDCTYPSNSSSIIPSSSINPEKFRAGYTQAAYEVSKVFASVPGLNVDFGTKLMKHLGFKLKDLQPPQNETTFERNLNASPSPSYQNKMNEFKFAEKNHEYQNIKHNFIVAITPPQSPVTVDDRRAQNGPENLIRPSRQIIVFNNQNQENTSDVWRPW